MEGSHITASALEACARANDLAAAKVFMKRDGSGVRIFTTPLNDITQETMLHIAVSEGHEELLEYMCKQLRGRNSSTLRSILSSGSRLLSNSGGGGQAASTSPVLASSEGWKMSLDVKDHLGWTPLHAAAQSGCLDCCSILMSYGADVTAKTNDGSVYLHYLARQKLFPAEEDFIAKQAGVPKLEWEFFSDPQARKTLDKLNLICKSLPLNVRNNNGETPLHAAGMYGRVCNAAVLVLQGALPFQQNIRGETPLHYAQRKGSRKCESYLLSIYPKALLIPADTWQLVLGWLDWKDLLSAGSTCQRLRQLARMDRIWRPLCEARHLTALPGIALRTDQDLLKNAEIEIRERRFPLSVDLAGQLAALHEFATIYDRSAIFPLYYYALAGFNHRHPEMGAQVGDGAMAGVVGDGGKELKALLQHQLHLAQRDHILMNNGEHPAEALVRLHSILTSYKYYGYAAAYVRSGVWVTGKQEAHATSEDPSSLGIALASLCDVFLDRLVVVTFDALVLLHGGQFRLGTVVEVERILFFDIAKTALSPSRLIWSITLLESEEERCFSGLDCDILERAFQENSKHVFLQRQLFGKPTLSYAELFLLDRYKRYQQRQRLKQGWAARNKTREHFTPAYQALRTWHHNPKTDDETSVLIRMIVIGSSGVGKTRFSIMWQGNVDTRLSFADIRLRPPEFVVQGSLLTFVPVDVRLLGVAIRGQLVDPIRPETRFANLPYRTAAGIFLLCSPFNQKSVDDLPNWLREIRMEARADTQVLMVQTDHGQRAPQFGDPDDRWGLNTRTPNHDRIDEFCARENLPLVAVKLSTGENCDLAVAFMILKIMEGQQVPSAKAAEDQRQLLAPSNASNGGDQRCSVM